MLLTANRTAQFFIQKEYHHVELQRHSLLLASVGSEEHIPFTVWNGEVHVQRGLFWGALQFFAHAKGEQQQSWLVQGLPWPECKQFAREAVAQYQQWHDQQCRQLSQYLPVWEESLYRLEHLPAYLPHSNVDVWAREVQTQLKQMDMTLEEAKLRLPERVSALETWLLNGQQALEQRNLNWLEQERRNWEVLFNQIESSPLNVSQQHAVLLNDDHNLVLAGAGSGKTSVLTARVAYLLQSHQATDEQLLLLAFGRDAAQELKQRLMDKIGLAAQNAHVSTFHQLGLSIINQVESNQLRFPPSPWMISFVKCGVSIG